MRVVFVFVLLGLASVPGFGLAQETAPQTQQVPQVKVPDTLEEAKEATLQIGDKIAEGLLGIIPAIWRNEVVPKWQSMWAWAKENVWQERLQPAWQRLFDQGRALLGQEVEKRAPVVKEQLEEEKQEIKEELTEQGKKATKGLWERFLDLFREE